MRSKEGEALDVHLWGQGPQPPTTAPSAVSLLPTRPTPPPSKLVHVCTAHQLIFSCFLAVLGVSQKHVTGRVLITAK